MNSSNTRPTGIVSYLLPSLADVLFICVLLTLSFIPNKGMLNDGDTGYHVRAGEFILETFSLPRLDPYSFRTPTLPWTVHEWLSEVVMALCHHAAGLAGVVVFYSFLLALTYYLFVRMLQARGITPLAAGVATVAVIGPSTVHWLARPHIFSLLIIVAWYWILDAYDERRRNALYLLPPLMLLWVNLHGGYIIGFVLLGAYFAGALLLYAVDRERWLREGKERARGYAKAVAASMVAALINPFGYKIFLFPFKLVFDKYQMDHTNEFLSPNFHENGLFKLLLLGLILLLAVSRKRLTFVQVLLTLLFTNMALYSMRYIPLFALIVVPIMLGTIDWELSAHIPSLAAFFRKRAELVSVINERARGIFWPSAATVLVLVLLWNGTVVHGFDPKKKAVAAVEFMKREQIPGRMFNNDEIGDLIIYGAHRQYKVFIDGRLDMYGTERLKEYFKVIGFSPGWEDVLRTYGIGWIIFDTDSTLVRFLDKQPEWRLIYSDKVASIFVRNSPEYAPLIAKYPNVRLAKIEQEKK